MAFISEATKHWLVPALIGAGMSLAAGYYHNDKDIATRVTALEAHRADDNQRLGSIESKIDLLVTWALGK